MTTTENLNLEEFMEKEPSTDGNATNENTASTDMSETTGNENTTSEEKQLTDKEKFIEQVNNLSCLSENTKKSILDFLEGTDFYSAPASTKFHNNVPGGLCNHSLHVAEVLMDLTKKYNLKWTNPDSPILIGLFHDICKVGVYENYVKNKPAGTNAKTGKTIWEQVTAWKFNDKNALYGIHGDRSVTILLMLRRKLSDFNLQELACIRYHMGMAQEGEGMAYNNAVNLEPMVMWTHIADQIASQTEPIVDLG